MLKMIFHITIGKSRGLNRYKTDLTKREGT